MFATGSVVHRAVGTRLRMLLAPVRSGTTAFLHQMSQSPLVDTATGVMKHRLREGGEPDYGVYRLTSRRPFLFYKASFGYRSAPECSYEPFRTSGDIADVRPVFMVRDPVQTLNSWRRIGWIGTDIGLFVLTYRHVINLFRSAAADCDQVRCVTYEHLMKHPEIVLPAVFAHWGIPYDDAILTWRTRPGDATITHPGLADRRAKITHNMAHGVHTSLLDGPSALRHATRSVVLTEAEIASVEREFRDDYLDLDALGRASFPPPGPRPPNQGEAADLSEQGEG